MNVTRLTTVMPTGKTHAGTVIFLHGSGDTGEGVRGWIRMLLDRELEFPHLKIIYPTAPLRPYTPLDGQPSNVWFDRHRIAPDVPEHLQTLESSADDLTHVINSEIKSGIPANKIVLGGFSMGGAMAMHLGYRRMPDLKGIFALSSFLNDNSVVYKELERRAGGEGSGPGPGSVPPLFMCHGDSDELVPLAWGQQTFSALQRLGVEGQFSVLERTFHELKRREMLQLEQWIAAVLPQAD